MVITLYQQDILWAQPDENRRRVDRVRRSRVGAGKDAAIVLEVFPEQPRDIQFVRAAGFAEAAVHAVVNFVHFFLPIL